MDSKKPTAYSVRWELLVKVEEADICKRTMRWAEKYEKSVKAGTDNEKFFLKLGKSDARKAAH